MLLLSVAAAQAQAPESVVISASPLSGSNVDPGKLPLTVELVTPADIARFGAPDLLQALSTQAPGVTLSEAQDNPFQPNLFYRGFEASPLAGDAQGLAVYAAGVRLNHPFGDTVDWDLIPQIAIAALTVESANPVFGLNALGGSVSMQFKNGFGLHGRRAYLAGGSFGRAEAAVEAGTQEGDIAFYGAAEHDSESGWRQHSPSNLYRVFGNVAAGGNAWHLQVDVLGARSDLTGNGVAPVELLQVSRSAVFTYPDSTQNAFGLVNLETNAALTDSLSLTANLYASRFDQRTRNGDVGNVSTCDANPALLCFDSGDALTGTDGIPIAAFPVQLTYGQLNRTATGTSAFGAALQANWNGSISAFEHRFTVGAAWDAGRTRFSADTAIGSLSPDRAFVAAHAIIDQPDRLIAPVLVNGANDYVGLYAAEQVDVTPELTATISGRYNVAHVRLQDLRETALTGAHDYARFNPSAGLSYALSSELTLYGSYSKANRAPSPAEFSCADPDAPCSLTNFFVADPPLKQVTAKTFEAGLRGAVNLAANADISWHAAGFRSDLHDDLQFIASPVIGRGFFENVGGTRRQGAEFELQAKTEFWRLSLNYSLTDATFRSSLVLNSPENPFSDENGQIAVHPGNHLPAIPAHVVKAMIELRPTEVLTLTLGMRAASGVYLRGDEANLNGQTPGYAVFDVSAKYRISDHLSAFAGVSNLFNQRYATFGAFSRTSAVPLAEAPGAADPRSLSPAAPRWFTVGVTATL